MLGHQITEIKQINVANKTSKASVCAGPPIISSEPVQYAVRGERGEVRCYIASTPPPDKIVSVWINTFTQY